MFFSPFYTVFVIKPNREFWQKAMWLTLWSMRCSWGIRTSVLPALCIPLLVFQVLALETDCIQMNYVCQTFLSQRQKLSGTERTLYPVERKNQKQHCCLSQYPFSAFWPVNSIAAVTKQKVKDKQRQHETFTVLATSMRSGDWGGEL